MSMNSSSLPAASNEQREIVRMFEGGNNVQIISVAGSGKTTTLLYLCQSAKVQGYISLIVTYNKKLSLETQRRVKELGLDNDVEVRTIHSAAGYAYKTVLKDDMALSGILSQNIPSTSPIFKFGVIMIDEAQDLRDEYYTFLRKITDNKRIVLVGDPKQSIYEFNDASPKYLIDYKRYFPSVYPWSSCKLIQSYRLTPTMGKFIETHVYGPNPEGEIRFVGANTRSNDRKVDYFVNPWRIKELETLLMEKIKKYGIDNVAILAPSVKPEIKTPLNILLKGGGNNTSALVRSNIAVIRRDNQLMKSGDGAEEKGKLLVSTYHSMKGCERECCFVYGVDESYFQYFAVQWNDPDNIPNSIYVALTRAKSELIIIQDKSRKVDNKIVHVNPLRTIKLNLLTQTCNIDSKEPIERKSQSFIDTVSKFHNKKETSPTEAIKFRNLTDMIALHSLIQIVGERKIKGVNNTRSLTIPYQTQGITHTGKYYGVVVPVLADNEKNNRFTRYAVESQNFLERYISLRIPRSMEEDEEINVIHVLNKIIQSEVTGSYINLSKAIYPGLAKEIKELMKLCPHADYHKVIQKLPHIMTYLLPRQGLEDKVLGDIEEKILSTFKTGDLCKLLILYDLYHDPSDYPAIKLLDWLDYDFINECKGLLCEFLGETKAEFEVPTEINYQHPIIPKFNHKKFKECSNEKIQIELACKPNEELKQYLRKNYMTINDYSLITPDLVPLSYNTITMNGYIDVVYAENTILEIKIRHEDDKDDLLQLATYMAMKKYNKGTLYNIVTGTVTEIEVKDPTAFLTTLTRNIINWDRDTVKTCTINYNADFRSRMAKLNII